MLPKIHRLRLDKDFKIIFRQSRQGQSGQLILRWAPSGKLFSRFGIVVSAKAAKKAVERNRLRRRIGEMLRSHLAEIKQGFDIIFIAKAGLTNLNYRELEKIAVELLRKAGVLN